MAARDRCGLHLKKRKNGTIRSKANDREKEWVGFENQWRFLRRDHSESMELFFKSKER
jgi:hypothetical protein